MSTDATTSKVTADRPAIDSLSFEQAQAELEQIVEQLENDQTGLEDALALWERGEQLHAWCQSKLDYAAARLEKIQITADDTAAVVEESAVGFVESGTPVPDTNGDAPADAPSMF